MTIQFIGIRYATAERFHPPEDEPFDLSSAGTPIICPQPDEHPLGELSFDWVTGLQQDEDCLRLTVVRPRSAGAVDPTARTPVPSAAFRPVIVWIHGGSNVHGAGDAPAYGAQSLADTTGAVIVKLTYRLGVLGYFGLGLDEHENLGLLDQLSALRWVARHIRRFGGDPDNVTIMGHSAGGDACAHLMIAEGSQGLFARAIILAAPLGLTTGRRLMRSAMQATAQKVQRELIGDTGESIDEAVEVAAEEITEMPPFGEHLDVDQLAYYERHLLRAALTGGFRAGMTFSVRYGVHPLPDQPFVALRQVAARIPVLMTYGARETALFAAGIPALRALADSRITLPVFDKLIDQTSKAVYTRAAHDFMDHHGAGGGRGRLLELTMGIPSRTPEAVMFAGCHTAEIPLLFDSNLGGPLRRIIAPAEAAAAATEFKSLVGAFAADGTLPRLPVPGLFEVIR